MEDRAVFGFDIKTDFDWKEYLVIYVQVFQPIANYVQQTAAKNQCAKKKSIVSLIAGYPQVPVQVGPLHHPEQQAVHEPALVGGPPNQGRAILPTIHFLISDCFRAFLSPVLYIC